MIYPVLFKIGPDNGKLLLAVLLMRVLSLQNILLDIFVYFAEKIRQLSALYIGCHYSVPQASVKRGTDYTSPLKLAIFITIRVVRLFSGTQTTSSKTTCHLRSQEAANIPHAPSMRDSSCTIQE